MRLLELFAESEMTLQDQLKHTALDMLAPLLAQQVPFVTVKQMIEVLRDSKPGVFVDRAMVVDLLDPTNCNAVEKIEGGKIYLKSTNDDMPDEQDGPDQKQKDEKQVHDTAVNAAQEAIKDS